LKLYRSRGVPRVALVPLIVLFAAISACATYKKCGFNGCAGDAQITADVQALIGKYPSLEAPNIVRIQTVDHVVYLYGQVDTDLQRLMAQEIALSVTGVRRVVNSIGLEFEGR
jgi:osmotically-inducible protein OsmY